MPENNEIKQSLEKTIDTLFSDTPGAPVSVKKPVKAPAPKAEAPKAAAPAAPKAEAPKAAAPAAPKAEAPKAAAPAAPKAEAPKAAAPAAPKAEAPKAASPAKNALTVSELKKLMNQRPEPRPMEKTPAWSIIMTVCALILSMSMAGVAVLASYFYFGPGSAAAEGNALIGYLAMVMCFVVCAIFVGFVVGCAFLLRKIERDIREIKSKI